MGRAASAPQESVTEASQTRIKAIVAGPGPAKLYFGVIRPSLWLAAGLLTLAASAAISIPDQEDRQAAIARIGADYQAQIQPVFQSKCFDCHSDRTHYPFYYRFPGAKQIIDRDIRRARKHLDMSKGFPFKNQTEPEKDLAVIRDVVSDDDMPPLLYRLAHRGSGLRDNEKTAILRWAEQGQSALMKIQRP